MRLINAFSFLVTGALLPIACGQRPPGCKVPFGPDNCDVADYCRIDLDQASMEGELAKLTEDSFRKAREIYENGGHSMPLAELTLATPLTQVALKGANVTGYSDGGLYVAGRVHIDREAGSASLQFEYTDPLLCQVGGLGEGDVRVSGCLAADGVVSLEFGDYQYAYNPLEGNENGRTLATISQMSGPDSCVYGSCAELYTDYYGLEFFANEWINAAFEQRQVNFENGVVDFSRIGFDGRAKAISKGTVVLSTFIEINRLLAKSVESCRDLSMDDALHYLRAAKCMYTGSLVGHSEDYSGGELLFTLADKMCVSFRTCGANGDELSGTSRVNSVITMAFQFGEDVLSNPSISEGCPIFIEIVEPITSWLYVPIIQGALRSSYRMESNATDEREYAEGATYAAALLPRIHALGGSSLAQRLHDAMKADSFYDATRVKSILEVGLYPTLLGLSCTHVGGLYDPERRTYVNGLEPCEEVEISEEEAEEKEGKEEEGELVEEEQEEEELRPLMSLEYFVFAGNNACPCKGDSCGPGTSSVDWYSNSISLEDCATYCLQYQFLGGALKGFTFESYPYGDNFENHYCACLFDFGHQQDNMFAAGFSGGLLEQAEEGIIDDVLMRDDDNEDNILLDDAVNVNPSSGVVSTQDGWVPPRNIGNALSYQAHCYYFAEGHYYYEDLVDEFIDDEIADDDDDDDDNEDEHALSYSEDELSNMSVQYDSCGIEGGQQFVRFHLCSGTECQSCSSSFTEHKVDMSTFLHLLVDYYGERQYRYCRSCDICLESRLRQNERPQFCIQTDPDTCYEECQRIKNMEENGYMDGADLIDCQLIYEDEEESLYAGPVCSSGGSGIKIGLFEDDLCELQDSREVEDYLKGEDGYAFKISYSLLKKTFLDCSSCFNEDALYDTARRLEQFVPLTKEMCTDLMAASSSGSLSSDWPASTEDAGLSSIQYHSCGVDNGRQFVKYHSCSGAKCQLCDSSTADEYVVDLNKYLEVLVEHHQEEQQRYCDICNECVGDENDDTFNPWTIQMNEYCGSQVEPGCYDDCQFMTNMEENGYIEDFELVECQVVHEDGTSSLYAGPQCNPDDSSSITIGLFKDELCQIPDERDVEDFLMVQDGSKLKIDYTLLDKSLGCSGCDHEYAFRRRRLDEEEAEEQMCTDLKMFSQIIFTPSQESVAPSLAPFFIFTGSGGSASGIALNEDDGINVTGPTVDVEDSEMGPDMLGQSFGKAQPTNEAYLTNETLPNRSRTKEPTDSPSSKPSESDVVSPEVEFPEAEEDYPSSTPVIVLSTACIAPLIAPMVAYWLNL